MVVTRERRGSLYRGDRFMKVLHGSRLSLMAGTLDNRRTVALFIKAMMGGNGRQLAFCEALGRWKVAQWRLSMHNCALPLDLVHLKCIVFIASHHYLARKSSDGVRF
jgi:hypothetical protein